MTKISRKKLSEDKMGLLIDQLWRGFASLKDKDEVHEFLHDLLSRTEIQMLAKRLEVVRLLNEGWKYEEIKNRLNISEATISKINNWKEAFGQGYQKVIERLKRESEKRKRKLPGFVKSSRSAAASIWS
ncbi:MAG: helix-turn-helix domain-containing protein [Candidatus Doudnabacteria bacterium]|nr:helix-turn-helix domain-containing protein [Candidatus Doudnabacteria bacterium]